MQILPSFKEIKIEKPKQKEHHSTKETEQQGIKTGGLTSENSQNIGEYIKSYAQSRKAENMLEFGIWNERPWEILDGNIYFHVYDEVQKQHVEEFKQGLVSYLRQYIDVPFAIYTKVAELPAQQQSNKLYSAKDKYDYLVSQNPNIEELKRRLGFELEY